MAIVLWAAWDHTTEFKFWRNPKLVKGVYQPLTPPVGLAGSMILPPPAPPLEVLVLCQPEKVIWSPMRCMLRRSLVKMSRAWGKEASFPLENFFFSNAVTPWKRLKRVFSSQRRDQWKKCLKVRLFQPSPGQLDIYMDIYVNIYMGRNNRTSNHI